ncbi:TPA: hypothetical protein ACGXQC_000860 [Bacillus cereus]
MTTINSFFEKQEATEWLNALPDYQKSVVSELLISNSHEEAATAWLEASIDHTSPFSTQPKSEKKFFDLLKKEVQKILCGSPDYAAERDELTRLTQSPENKTAFVSAISALIGAKVGLAASFIAPAIVIIFMIIGKASLNAWCEMQIN